MVWPFVSRRERLRRQAARWVARLNGPFDEQDRAEFERWYRSSAEHAEAYDRVAALFNAAGRARRPEASIARSSGRRPYLSLEEDELELARVAILAFLDGRWHVSACLVDGEGRAVDLLWKRSFDDREEAQAAFDRAT